MKIQKINGVIVKKFIDTKNHNNPTLLISNKNKDIKYHFSNERSKFYEYVNVGDVLNKKSTTLEIEINRNGKIIFKILDFDCQNKTTK